MLTPFKHDFTVEMTVIQEGWVTTIPQSRHLHERAKVQFSLLKLLVLGVTWDTLLFQSACSQSLLFPSQSQPLLPKRNRRNLESFWIANRLFLQLWYSLWSAWMCSFNFYLSDKLRGRSWKGNTEKELCCFLSGKIPNSIFPSDGSLSSKTMGGR